MSHGRRQVGTCIGKIALCIRTAFTRHQTFNQSSTRSKSKVHSKAVNSCWLHKSIGHATTIVPSKDQNLLGRNELMHTEMVCSKGQNQYMTANSVANVSTKWFESLMESCQELEGRTKPNHWHPLLSKNALYKSNQCECSTHLVELPAFCTPDRKNLNKEPGCQSAENKIYKGVLYQ